MDTGAERARQVGCRYGMLAIGRGVFDQTVKK